jgi:hypothetical protein
LAWGNPAKLGLFIEKSKSSEQIFHRHQDAARILDGRLNSGDYELAVKI